MYSKGYASGPQITFVGKRQIRDQNHIKNSSSQTPKLKLEWPAASHPPTLQFRDEQERVVVLSRKSPFRYLYSPSVQR